MALNDYHFITHWRLKADIDEVYLVLADAESLTRWWPSVYLDVRVTKEGDENRIGREIALYTKGWLPYTLRWDFVVTEVKRPTRIVLEARGDFVGRGIWALQQDGDFTDLTYDWKIRADKPLLRMFSFLMKPVFSANHHWAMQMGEKSINLELARRHAPTPEARAKIPAAPPPTFVKLSRK